MSGLDARALAAVDEVLASTRSVRRRLDFKRPVPESVLLECIDLAVQAPLGLGGESWRFLVVTAPSVKARLAELYRQALDDLVSSRGIEIKPSQQALVARLADMPAMILVCDSQPPPDSDDAGQIGYYGSILPAAWSLMLALRARGLGATWTSLLAARQAEVAEVVGLPPGALLTVMLPVAYTQGARLGKAVRRPAEEVTYWNAWGRAEDIE